MLQDDVKEERKGGRKEGRKKERRKKRREREREGERLEREAPRAEKTRKKILFSFFIFKQKTQHLCDFSPRLFVCFLLLCLSSAI